MKPKLTTLVWLVGAVFVLGPWLLIDRPSKWWLLLSLLGVALTTTVGYGAKMEILGKSDTGEELIRSVWAWIKAKATYSQPPKKTEIESNADADAKKREP